jgi:hypothetical protein
MKRLFRERWPVLFALVIVLALLGLAAQRTAKRMPLPLPGIAEGSDCWHTEPGTFQKLPTLTPGTFGPGSQTIPTAKAVVEFEGVPLDPDFVAAPYPEGCGCPEKVDVHLSWVDRHGSPVAGDSAHRVRQVTDLTTDIDTCIRRKTRAKFNKPRTPVKVDIELVALSLKSVKPLEVTYRGKGKATSTKLFDVFVTQSARQPPGSSMTFTPGHIGRGNSDGRINLDDLRIAYDVEFREQGGTATYNLPGLDTRLRSPRGGRFRQP